MNTRCVHIVTSEYFLAGESLEELNGYGSHKPRNLISSILGTPGRPKSHLCISNPHDFRQVRQLLLRVFRLLQRRNWCLCCSGMWHHVTGWMVSLGEWCPVFWGSGGFKVLGTIHSVTWHHIPEEQRPPDCSCVSYYKIAAHPIFDQIQNASMGCQLSNQNALL
jgi:hypothetical protein